MNFSFIIDVPLVVSVIKRLYYVIIFLVNVLSADIKVSISETKLNLTFIIFALWSGQELVVFFVVSRFLQLNIWFKVY